VELTTALMSMETPIQVAFLWVAVVGVRKLARVESLVLSVVSGLAKLHMVDVPDEQRQDELGIQSVVSPTS